MVSTDDNPDSFKVDHALDFYAKYETREILGSGIGSTVRRCISKSAAPQEFAVKILDLSMPTYEEARELMESTSKEVECLRLCMEHPNVCKLKEAFFSDSYIFLVLELCRGGEFFDYLNNVVTLSEKQSRHVMRQLFSAIEFIHEQGIVHRDIKPENILLKSPALPTSPLVVKLSDFGFSHRLASSSERLRALCGTPSYMAPEMLTGAMDEDLAGYGREVDLWAAGVTLFLMLSGTCPFWHRRQLTMIRHIREGKFSFSAPIWMDVSDLAKDLIVKLLIVDPEKRLSATQALQHPFLAISGERNVNCARRFVGAAQAIRFIHRLQSSLRSRAMHSVPVSSVEATDFPYKQKTIRQQIDAAAFKVYGHWVKKEEQQNRMALFQSDEKHNSPDDGAQPGVVLPLLKF